MTPDPPVSSRRLQAGWICGTGDGPSEPSALPSELWSQVHVWKVWVVGGERDTQSPACWLLPPIPALGTLRHGIPGQPGPPNTLSQGRKTVGLCTKEEATRVWGGLGGEPLGSTHCCGVFPMRSLDCYPVTKRIIALVPRQHG